MNCIHRLSHPKAIGTTPRPKFLSLSISHTVRPMHTGVYPVPPEIKLLPLENINSPSVKYLFDDQLTCPVYANNLLQHETENIHTTKKVK